MKSSKQIFGIVVATSVVVTATGCAGKSWFSKQSDSTPIPAQSAAKAPEKRQEDRNSVQSANKFLGYEAPSYSERMAKARTNESSGKPDAARAIYQELIREFPDRWEPVHRLALVADNQKRHREAISLYEQAARLKPMDAQIFNDMGYCFYLQGQLDKAESALTKAVALAPSESRYRNNLGLVYGHQNRFNEALESFRYAGSEADAQYNLAFILASRDDAEGAKRHFRLAVAADPSFEKARDALVSFERYEDDPHGYHGETYLADGRHWIPYVESKSSAATGIASQASPASHPMTVPSAARTVVAERAQSAQFTTPAP